jgi:hypothetical protein
VVGDRGPADGAEVDLIAGRKGIEAVFRHHPAVLQVVIAAPRELRKAELERRIIARRGLEYLHAGAHDLGTYTVTPYDPDLDHGSMLATGGGS